MSASTPEMLPVPGPGLEDSPLAVLPVQRPQPDLPRQKSPVRRPSILWRFLSFLVGWTWRWGIGAALCMNYFTSILVAGWMYRWMQGHVLYKWWKKSRFAREGTFQEFCEASRLQAPVRRPRWFLRERIRQTVTKSGPQGKPPGPLRTFFRLLTVPWHSLWLNLKLGVTALFCTFLLTGPGCLLMLFGWEYGWLNSYHKGYEFSGVGVSVSLAGMVLFVVSLYYVLMAQVHQAVIGDRMAFFDFHFVWRLVRTKPTAYCFVFILLALISLPFEIVRSALFAPQTFGNDPNLSNAEVLQYLQAYTFVSCLVFFPALLFLRRLTANVYSAAVLKALEKGTITRNELHPKLESWLDRLGIIPVPAPEPTPLVKTARAGFGWIYRNKVFAVLFLAALVFTAKRYPGEFLIYHPVAGFLNHEWVQAPAFDLITGTAASQAKQED